MKARHESKLTMYRAVLLCCSTHMSLATSVPAFSSLYDQLKQNTERIDTLLRPLSEATKGISIDKSVNREEMCRLSAAIAGIVYAWASVQDDNTTKARVDFAFRDLHLMRDEEVAAQCILIHSLAVAHQAELAAYGLTVDMPATLHDLITGYQSRRTLPRQAIESKAAIRKEFNSLFDKNDRLLREEMDKLMKVFLLTHEDFYLEYTRSRTIFDPPVSHTRLKGKIGDLMDNPLGDVEVTIENETFTASALTDALGYYDIRAKIGIYTVLITKPGYQSHLHHNLRLKRGQSTHLNTNLTLA